MRFLNKIYLSLILVLASFAVLIFFLVVPAIREILEQSNQLVAQRKELASIELSVKNFEDLKEHYQSFGDDLKEMEDLLNQELFIDPEIPISFINFFKEQAGALDLSLRISQFAPKEGGSQEWSNLAFRIDGAGSFVKAMRFLEKLEHSRWLVEVTSLNIIKQEAPRELTAEGKAGNGYVEFNLFIKIYAQKKN